MSQQLKAIKSVVAMVYRLYGNMVFPFYIKKLFIISFCLHADFFSSLSFLTNRSTRIGHLT
jgi:hypothetical protein